VLIPLLTTSQAQQQMIPAAVLNADSETQKENVAKDGLSF
jgi:hypothetical protein